VIDVSLHSADLGNPVPNEPSDRRKLIVNLYRIGKSISEIATITKMSRGQVYQILKEESAEHIKRAGTDGLRVERACELELVREHMFGKLFRTDECGEPVAPNKDDLASYARIVNLQAKLMGVGSAGPIYAPGDYRGSRGFQPDVATYKQADGNGGDGKE